MAINLAKNIAGAGVLSLSAGIASFSGAKAAVLPATLLLLFLGAVSAYSFSLLARVGEDNGTATIRETWSKLFGEKWAIIPDATIIFECMCAATSFAIIIGETFSSVATLCGARAALAAPNAWIVLRPNPNPNPNPSPSPNPGPNPNPSPNPSPNPNPNPNPKP